MGRKPILLMIGNHHGWKGHQGLTIPINVQSIEHFRYYAGWADKIFGKVAPTNGDFQALVYKEPLGKLFLAGL